MNLEAFPFTRCGTLKGRVESIGSDAVKDEKLGLLYPAPISVGAVQSALRPGVIGSCRWDAGNGGRHDWLAEYLMVSFEPDRQSLERSRGGNAG